MNFLHLYLYCHTWICCLFYTTLDVVSYLNLSFCHFSQRTTLASEWWFYCLAWTSLPAISVSELELNSIILASLYKWYVSPNLLAILSTLHVVAYLPAMFGCFLELNNFHAHLQVWCSTALFPIFWLQIVSPWLLGKVLQVLCRNMESLAAEVVVPVANRHLLHYLTELSLDVDVD
jgi:hypothetical protein